MPNDSTAPATAGATLPRNPEADAAQRLATTAASLRASSIRLGRGDDFDTETKRLRVVQAMADLLDEFGLAKYAELVRVAECQFRTAEDFDVGEADS